MNENKSLKIRNILSIALVVLYAAGMLCMFLNAMQLGLLLWTLSTAGGLAVMYRLKAEEKKAAEAERLRKAAEGEDEKPCE